VVPRRPRCGDDSVSTGVLAAAALPAVLLDLVLSRRRVGRPMRLGIALAVVVTMLLPMAGLSAAQQLRAVIGDLSVASLVLMAWYGLAAVGPHGWQRAARELVFLAGSLVVVAAVFYPLSLGATLMDPYAHGYYPTVLSALLLAVFVCAVLAGWPLTAALIGFAYAGFVLRWLESDNLWDYLFDVPLVIAALVGVVLGWSRLRAVHWRSLDPRRITVAALVVAASFLFFAVVLSRVNPASFANDFTVEDGFVEWTTSIVLFVGFCFSVHRYRTARQRFDWRGRAVR